ncbi:hypothetical protein NPIL_438801, partial [Nephila pilipes]
ELEPLFDETKFEYEFMKSKEYRDKDTIRKCRANKRIRELCPNVSGVNTSRFTSLRKIAKLAIEM